MRRDVLALATPECQYNRDDYANRLPQVAGKLYFFRMGHLGCYLQDGRPHRLTSRSYPRSRLQAFRRWNSPLQRLSAFLALVSWTLFCCSYLWSWSVLPKCSEPMPYWQSVAAICITCPSWTRNELGCGHGWTWRRRTRFIQCPLLSARYGRDG